jgi:cell wall assembly regulator SMI1
MKDMLLEQIPSRFMNLSSQRQLKYVLGNPAPESKIKETEQRLGVSFPAQVKSFYRHYDGLRVDDPQLEILPIEQIELGSTELLHFATFDGNHHLYFNVSRVNEAEQWDIVTADGFRVTVTMARFLVKSNVGVD